MGELPVEHGHEPVLVDHQVADPEVAVVDDPRPLEREPLPAPHEPELDRGMRLVDLVELGVQALPEIRDGQLGQRRDRDRVHLGELVGHLHAEPCRRRLDDAAADRLAVHELHHERLPPVEIAEVRDRLRDPDAGIARRGDHGELVAERERVDVDHAAAGATEEQLASVGGRYRPGLLRGAAGQLRRLRDDGAERLLDASFTASFNPRAPRAPAAPRAAVPGAPSS